MPFTTIAKPAIGTPTTKTLYDAIIDNLNYLKSLSDAVGGLDGDKIANGSFETDSDADGKPDAWTVTTPWSGGTFALADQNAAAGNSYHGRYAAKFTSTGSGGGHMVSADYFPVTPGQPIFVSWAQKGTADVKNVVQIFWYQGDTGKTPSATASKTLLSEVAGNPADWQVMTAYAFPPSDARFAKLKFIGCDETDATAGSTYFDAVSIADVGFKNRATFPAAAGTYKFVAPITGLVRVRAWGGGAGGYSHPNGGGGGGGEYVEGFAAVTLGTAYSAVVGGGGAAGANGNDSTFAATSVVAKGGTAGTNPNGGAGGTGGTGFSTIAGQSGSSYTNGQHGGFAVNGGSGGAGGATSPGIAPGGGGAGSSTAGAGAAGQIVVEW